jgi:hypothetical protein
MLEPDALALVESLRSDDVEAEPTSAHRESYGVRPDVREVRSRRTHPQPELRKVVHV